MNLFKSALACAAGLTLLGASAAAQPAAPSMANPNFAAVQPGDYVIEPIHTRILFSLSHLGPSTWYGDFPHASGAAKIDPAHPAASSVEVSVPMDSIETTNTTLDGELKGADWFDAAKFPTMTFKSTTVKPNGDGGYNVTGDLTLHGVTRQQTFVVDGPSTPGKDPWGNTRIGLSATAKISRKDFDLTWNATLETGGILVGDDVQTSLEAQFIKA